MFSVKFWKTLPDLSSVIFCYHKDKSIVILGGAKVHDKIPLLNNMIDKVDEIIVGGGVSYTFLKKVYGMEIGMSLFDKTGFEQIDAILEKVTL